MEANQAASLRPRKRPVQARSTATVEALLEASIQVLLNVGCRKLTTTLVAERAGTSVGTLYQYFPNKDALLAAMLTRYLEGLVSAVVEACEQVRGADLSTVAAHLVRQIVREKLKDPHLARAIHEPLVDSGSARKMLIIAAISPAIASIRSVLCECPGFNQKHAETAARLIVVTCTSAIQAAVVDGFLPNSKDELCLHLIAMIEGYLLGLDDRQPINGARQLASMP